jgi:hypothetical protein
MKKYVVTLEPHERARLEQIVRVGKSVAYRIRHANILLAVDQAGPKMTDARAAEAFGVTTRAIEHLRQRCVEQGLEAALERKKQSRPSVPALFDGHKEAQLIALACGPKPEGRTRWTLQLLADRVVELKIVEHCTDSTIHRVLQKTN